MKQDVIQAHIERRLTAQNFSRSKQPEMILGAAGTFFGSTEPDPAAAAHKAALSAQLFANRAAPGYLGAAAVALPARSLQALPLTPFDPKRPPPLAQELRALLSGCIRSDWQDRPSAATMLARFEALALAHFRPHDHEAVEELLKGVVQKAVQSRSTPDEGDAAPSASALKLPKNRPYLRTKSSLWQLRRSLGIKQPTPKPKGAEPKGAAK